MTYRVATKLVKLPHFSLVNIVAGREVVPELIQHEVTPARIAAAAELLLQRENYQKTCAALSEVTDRLGQPGASHRAAETIARVLQPETRA
jgi:lipid-A-disaccharide synthase